MVVDLPPKGQIEVLASNDVKTALKLPADTAVFAEPAIPSHRELQSDPTQKARLASMNTAIRERKRLTNSSAPCYGELIASNLFVQRAPLTGTQLRVMWYFRNFGANSKLEPSYEGWSVTSVAGYTTTSTEQAQIAHAKLRDAFLTSLVNWAAANLEKRPEPEHRTTRPPGH
jgi:hypothetical protein